jgi:hypothetical protein
VVASKAELRLVQTMRHDQDPFNRAEALLTHDSQFGPRGRFQKQVTSLRRDIDEAFWRLAQSRGLDEGSVQSYLRYFAQGLHGDEARRRLDQLRFFAQRDQERQAALAAEQRRAEEAERRRIEEENERLRDVVRGGLEQWLRTALTLPQWDVSMEYLYRQHSQLREQWGREPLPTCVQQVCRQTVEAAYFFSRPGRTRLDRHLSLVRQVGFRDGRVVQLTGYYTGRGFVDWLEMGSAEPIVEDNADTRELARDAILAVVQGTLATLRAAAIEEEPQEPGELLRLRDGDLVISVKEFPMSYAAGRVDGFEVTYFPLSPSPPIEDQPIR